MTRAAVALCFALVRSLLALITSTASAAPVGVTLDGPSAVMPLEEATLRVSASGPVRAGDKVTLEHKAYGIHWYASRTVRLDSSLRASFTLSQKVVGNYDYRVRLHATSKHASALTSTYTLRVVSTTVPAPSPDPEIGRAHV